MLKKSRYIWDTKTYKWTNFIQYILNYEGKGIPVCDLVSNNDGFFPWKPSLKLLEDLDWKGAEKFRRQKFIPDGDHKYIKKYGN